MNEHKHDRILRDAEVGELTGTSRTTRWRMIKAQQFPSPVKLSPTGSTIGFRESEVQAWIASRPATTSRQMEGA